MVITDFELTTGNLPNSLTDIGMDGMQDPWGNPYVYANHGSIPPGLRRKDGSLVPINSDYDLYSKGEDGLSSPPLTANNSRDDIVRARNGEFFGKASEY
jgi:general secretion pathway protein G